MIGIGYLALGDLDNAVKSFERMRAYAPKNTIPLKFLAVAYAELGENEKAKKAIEPFVKSGVNLRGLMHLIATNDAALRERYANALLKAGLPGEPGGYYKILHDKRLNEKEIEDLIFGHTMVGFDPKTGKDVVVDRKLTFPPMVKFENGYNEKGNKENFLCKWSGKRPTSKGEPVELIHCPLDFNMILGIKKNGVAKSTKGTESAKSTEGKTKDTKTPQA